MSSTFLFYDSLDGLFSVIPNLMEHMQSLTSCHLPANLRSKLYLDNCIVIFRQEISNPCLILSGPMYWKPRNGLMLKTKVYGNIPSSMELLSMDKNITLCFHSINPIEGSFE